MSAQVLPKPVREMTSEEFDAYYGLDSAELDRIADEYENDMFPEGVHADYRPGRPRVLGEDTIMMSLRVPRDLAEALSECADELDISRSEYVRRVLTMTVASREMGKDVETC